MKRLYLAAICTLQLYTSSAANAAPGDALNRAGLTATFTDEFNTFSWHEVDANGFRNNGTWATYLGYRWAPFDDVRNHAQLANEEEALYLDPHFRGAGANPAGINPYSIKNGVLSITATRIPRTPELYNYGYASGLMTTQYSFAQRYGVFEMRAKLPEGKGLWPAFWLLPADKAWPPEIDILEVLGHEPNKFYTTLHSKAGGKHSKSAIPVHNGPNLSEAFHTYAVEWGPKEIIFYFDDKEIAREPTPGDMHTPFYILANLAVGGKWPGSPDEKTKFPASYEIDYIRAWQRDSYRQF